MGHCVRAVHFWSGRPFTVSEREQYHLRRDIYTALVGDINRRHGLQFYLHADNTQLYVTFNPRTLASLAEAKQSVITCSRELPTWMICNRLQFNDDKTEALLLYNKRLRHHVDVTTIKVGNTSFTFSETARNLGGILILPWALGHT